METKVAITERVNDKRMTIASKALRGIENQLCHRFEK